MKYVILVSARGLASPQDAVGPYSQHATAEARLAQLTANGTDACILAMTGDSAYFGKPVGNRTNHN